MNTKFTPRSFLFVIAIVAIVLSACAPAPAGPVQQANQNQQVIVVVESAPCSTCGQAPAAPAVESVPQVHPEIPAYFGSDGIGPEEHFPDEVNVLGIAELWDANASFCALVKVLEGENLSWKLAGSYWLFANSDYLDLRWPSHKKEYLAKDANCHVYNSVAAFLATNPTYK